VRRLRAAPHQRTRAVDRTCYRDPIQRIYRSPGSTGRSAGEVVRRPPPGGLAAPIAIPDPEEESHAATE
jgi:hypothetical protein